MTFSFDDKTFDRKQLPNDPEALKDIIEGLVHHFSQKIGELLHKIDQLEHEVATLKKKQFGQKSEKLSVNKTLSSLENSNKDEPHKKHPGRHKLPDHLERARIPHDLNEEEKVCPLCQGHLVKIQEMVSEQLDVIPAKLQVKEHVRFKYACRHCYGSIMISKLPDAPIDKGLPSANLLAHVLTNKFYDHVPFYRQQRWFRRHGYEVSRSTLWSWEEKCAIALEPLVKALGHELVTGDHLFTDDTPMPTLEKGQSKAKIGRIWAYTRREALNQKSMTVYEYTPDRKGIHSQIFLKDFKGYLQVDAFAGFNKLFINENTITEVGCMAHARRKFIEVTSVDPHSHAFGALKLIQELYKIERFIKQAGYSDEQRKYLRKRRSKPFLKGLYRWLKKYQSLAPPKSSLGQAIGYAFNHWKALTAFLGDGRLEIDNNRSERAIKPIVIGRKNFLFMGGPRGGWAAAIIFSLIETCRQNNVDPQAYLADVLERLPTHPNRLIKDLLPHHWKPSYDLPMAQAA